MWSVKVTWLPKRERFLVEGGGWKRFVTETEFRSALDSGRFVDSIQTKGSL